MKLEEAIDIRCSNRKYLATPIEIDILEKLRFSIEKYNKEANLNLQLVLNNGAAFKGLSKSYGLFTGVENYIALVGEENDNFKEKIGYYGEKIVLEATQLGLGTCWVGGTFDKNLCDCNVNAGEVFFCVITLGYVAPKLSFKEKAISKAIHFKKKSIDELYEADCDLPKWFLDGMVAVQKAPSAVNKQPVTVHFKAGIVSASVKHSLTYESVDMGIAKLHFEIGSGGGIWQWGNNAKFRSAE